MEIAVLNHFALSVDIVLLSQEEVKRVEETNDVESILVEKGYRLNDISFMVADSIEVRFN